MDQDSQEPEDIAGKVENINSDRPSDAPPVPSQVIKRYDKQITGVWWHAKGRETDPTIGVEINGLRKTFGGYVWNDWWYFMKAVHPADSEDELPQCYVYRKKKVADPDNPDNFEIIEEYIGSDFIDPDSDLPLPIPLELKHSYKDLCN